MRTFKVSRQDITKNEYYRLHQRVRKVLGKAAHCSNESCKNTNAKRFEWALKKGRPYSDNPDDYFPLCQSCHRRYDIMPNTREKMSISAKGNRARISVFARVDQFDLYGNHIATYETITKASKETGTPRSCIWAAMEGRYKQANNFLWVRSKNKSHE